MTRVPKFRAWVSDKEKLLPVEEIGWEPEGIGLLCKGEEDWLAGDNLVLMQSTGLKDCNGVEIYEGDIVKITFPKYDDGFISEVRFSHGCLCIDVDGDLITFHQLLTESDTDYTIEVIGNIYENK